jgi:nitroreductase
MLVIWIGALVFVKICFSNPATLISEKDIMNSFFAIDEASCTIALTALELAALPFGLGACWAGFLKLAAMFSLQVHESLDLPPHHAMHGGLMIGYPQETFFSIPPRKQLRIEWR